jgi:iron(III) transport system permease protein
MAERVATGNGLRIGQALGRARAIGWPDWLPAWPRGSLRSPWTLAALGLGALVALPVLVVLGTLLTPRLEVWAHLWRTQLVELLANTLLLLLGVGAGAGVLGTSLAWLVAMYRFPGHAIFEWALLLPLAMPAYVIGFAFLGLLDFTGPVQTGLRALLGPGFRLPGLGPYASVPAVMVLVFYPYVYLMARTAFLEQRTGPLEVARSLGRTSSQAFVSVAIPMARPAIAAGVALTLMEALADFGTVSTFGYRTLTEGIYRVWFGMFDRTAAGQLAAVLMLAAGALLLLEKWARGQARFTQSQGRRAAANPPRLAAAKGAAAAAFCGGVLAVALVLPVAVLVAWAVEAVRSGRVASTYPALAWNTVGLALAAAAVTTLAGVILAYGTRLAPSPPLRAAKRVAGLGYAVPGAVVAVGILLVIAWIDHTVLDLLRRATGREIGLLLTGSVAGLLIAYTVRFIALSLQSVEAGMARIPPSMDEVARSLRAGPGRILARIHFPLLRGALLTGALLVFVDVMKEMPATMLIRPFGLDTLAVEVWQRTSESQWHEAAVPALTIVAVGMLPVALLTRLVRRASR